MHNLRSLFIQLTILGVIAFNTVLLNGCYANTATEPTVKTDGWVKRHQGFAAEAATSHDIVFLGDSITDRARREEVWNKHFDSMKTVNFGIGGDRTENLLWRIQNGELSGPEPKVVVLLIGTNNLRVNTNDEIVEGITAVVQEVRSRVSKSKLLLLGLFPREAQPDAPNRGRIKEINTQISKLAENKFIYFLDIGAAFLESDGTISAEVMSDYLHLTARGYQIWIDSMNETLSALLKE